MNIMTPTLGHDQTEKNVDQFTVIKEISRTLNQQREKKTYTYTELLDCPENDA